MIIKLIEKLFPRGVFYDNMGPKDQGIYITLTKANIEFTKDQIVIINDDWLFYGVAMTYEQAQQIIDNKFIDGEVKLKNGKVVFVLNENLYRVYDQSGKNWIRVSRENLIDLFNSPTGAYGEVNPKYTDQIA